MYTGRANPPGTCSHCVFRYETTEDIHHEIENCPRLSSLFKQSITGLPVRDDSRVDFCVECTKVGHDAQQCHRTHPNRVRRTTMAQILASIERTRHAQRSQGAELNPVVDIKDVERAMEDTVGYNIARKAIMDRQAQKTAAKGLTCALVGCSSPVYRDPTGRIHPYCSKGHADRHRAQAQMPDESRQQNTEPQKELAQAGAKKQCVRPSTNREEAPTPGAWLEFIGAVNNMHVKSI